MLAIADRRLGIRGAAADECDGDADESDTRHRHALAGRSDPPELAVWPPLWRTLVVNLGPRAIMPTALPKSAIPALAPPAMPAAIEGVCRKKMAPRMQRAMKISPPAIGSA